MSEQVPQWFWVLLFLSQIPTFAGGFIYGLTYVAKWQTRTGKRLLLDEGKKAKQ